ncbi:MAG: hypothetical protein NXH75_12565 [Halobacteriovoraceae bacterium]|nr:hypothetical protein [Halobacteriovoraceae bacterium]
MNKNLKLLFIGIGCFILVGLISFKDKIFTSKNLESQNRQQTVKKTSPPSPPSPPKDKKSTKVYATNKDKIPMRKKYQNLKEKEKTLVVQFQDQRDELILQLPLVSDLQSLKKGEAHHITPGLLKTGKRLSLLKELVLKYPKVKALQEEADSFYETCADDRDFPISIRSLCLFSRLQLAKNRKETFDISPYPLEIKQMVMELAPSKK